MCAVVSRVEHCDPGKGELADMGEEAEELIQGVLRETAVRQVDNLHWVYLG